jgi:hypothetical protein
MTQTQTARRALGGALVACWTGAALASVAVLADLIPTVQAIAARSYVAGLEDGLAHHTGRDGGVRRLH